MPKKQTISDMVIEADSRRTALTIEGIAVKLGVKKKANGPFPTRFMDRVIRCTGFITWEGPFILLKHKGSFENAIMVYMRPDDFMVWLSLQVDRDDGVGVFARMVFRHPTLSAPACIQTRTQAKMRFESIDASKLAHGVIVHAWLEAVRDKGLTYGWIDRDLSDRIGEWMHTQLIRLGANTPTAEVDSDTAFIPPFGTVRVCRGCGCLVAGGPTVCRRCAEET